MQKTPIYALSSLDIENILIKHGSSPECKTLLMNLIYRQPLKALDGFTQLSGNVRKYLKQNYSFKLPKIIECQKACDETVKFLIEFSDGKTVEAVALKFRKKLTLCLSCQVGCAMNCSFCYTATQGLKRSLLPAEIVMQFLVAKRYMKEVERCPYSFTNIVFMGQGEPLHNFDNLKKSIEILTDQYGISLSKKNITVSTCGYLPGLKRFNELGVNIALSLHSTNTDIRNQLIPINKAYPLEEVINELERLKLRPRQAIVYEYLLIKNLNHHDSDVEGLCKLLKNKNAYINIIPYNEFPGSKYQRPCDEEIESFKNKLVSKKLKVMVRKTKGDDILAACGQLKS